jgi:hypothetical protein
MSAFSPRIDILPKTQKMLWPELAFAATMGFTLYGGTAIALRLGHRESIDFDFFSDEPLNPFRLTSETSLLQNGQVIQNTKDTLTFLLQRGEGSVKVSFFGGLVPRRIAGRVGEPGMTNDNVLQVASLEDLFATKVKVLLDRAEAKDYIDIAALLRHGESLEHALASAVTIYGRAYQPEDSLKALTYFDDGDLHTIPRDDQNILVTEVSKIRNLPIVQLRSTHLNAKV